MTNVLVTLSKLPEKVWTTSISDPTLVICIKRGVMGYFPAKQHDTVEAAKAQAERLNAGKVTTHEIQCMEIGSCFGWEVPGADPDYKVRAAA